jgi:hypothetical protein
VLPVTSPRVGARRHPILAVATLLLVLAAASQVAPAQGAPRAVAAATDCRWRVAATAPDGYSRTGMISVSSNDVWTFGWSMDGRHTDAQHWDGKTWKGMDMAGADLYGGSANGPSDVWAAGAGFGGVTFEHWDGARWSASTLPFSGFGKSISILSDTDVWAAGNAGADGFGVFHYDGFQWTKMAVPLPTNKVAWAESVKALAADDVWVVGTYTDGLGLAHPLAEHWDGTTWSEVSVPAPLPTLDGTLQAIDGKAGDLWAGGDSFGASPLLDQTYLVHWDGKAFKQVSAPGDIWVWSVSMTGSNDVWASGRNMATNVPVVDSLHWDGTSWSVRGRANPDDISYWTQIGAVGDGEAWMSTFSDENPNDHFRPGRMERYSCQPQAVPVAAIRGTDGQLWQKIAGAAWTSLGGQLGASPAVVTAPRPSGTDGTVYVAVGTDHDLWVRDSTHGWQRINEAPLYCLNSPSASVIAHDLYLACEGADHALWYAMADESSGYPHTRTASWHSLGGTLIAGPAIGDIGGVPTFIAIQAGGHAWQRTVAGAWTEQPWMCQGRPALASEGAITHFACDGVDGALLRADNVDSVWSPASSLGGSFTGGVGIAAIGGTVTYYAEGADQVVYERSVTGIPVSRWRSDGLHASGGAAGGAGIPPG